MRDFTNKVNDTAPLASGVLDANEDNVRFEELEKAVLAAGIALDPPQGPDSRTDMLAESMTRHVGAALAATDSGSANTYVLTMVGAYRVPVALFAEMRARFRPGHANSGASTINAFGLGTKSLLDHTLSPLSGGELEVGRDCEVIYRPTVGAGSWVLPAWANALYVDPSPTAPTSIGDGEGWSVNTGSNTGNLNFPGLVNSATLAASDIFARYVSGVGHKGVTWAQIAGALTGATGGLINVRLITTSSTYTKTAGTTRALVFATGGGGAGGGNGPGQPAGGGGAGATAIDYVDLSGTSTVACLIGAGGAPAGGQAAGGNGGQTSFGSYAIAGGGFGGGPPGTNSDAQGGEGGAATAGLMRLKGSAGTSCAVRSAGGVGGNSFWGGAGWGGNSNGISNDDTGRAAGGYGSGGGGSDGGPPISGGAGAPGCILVLEFA